MKKVAIITLTKNPNFGNVLQNLALQKVVSKMGYDVETIKNCTNSSLFVERYNLKQKIKILINRNDLKNKEKRRKRFVECCKNNIKYSDIRYKDGHFSGDISIYDYFITGSDQVWNPYFGFASDFEMLSFAPKEKRLSYSASFGVSNILTISEDKINSIISALDGFKEISVREVAGKKIVESYLPVKCRVDIDPTMLITRNEWLEIMQKPAVSLPERYIVVYMLGEISREYKNYIENVAKTYEADIINIFDEKYFCINPLEFVWIIANAKFVCTDSFHATVFSILFQKGFVIFDRKDMHENQNSRFETLLDKTGISKNVIYREEQESILIDINWESVNEKLELERASSMTYLIDSLS